MLTFLPGFNDGIIFPGEIYNPVKAQIWLCHNNYLTTDGITLDGTIMNITHTFELGLVIAFDILATLGLIFAIGCLIFNIVFRKKKYGKINLNLQVTWKGFFCYRIMKISSPSLNYFIILGALLMYTSIYFVLLPSLNSVIVLTGCLVSDCFLYKIIVTYH